MARPSACATRNHSDDPAPPRPSRPVRRRRGGGGCSRRRPRVLGRRLRPRRRFRRPATRRRGDLDPRHPDGSDGPRGAGRLVGLARRRRGGLRRLGHGRDRAGSRLHRQGPGRWPAARRRVPLRLHRGRDPVAAGPHPHPARRADPRCRARRRLLPALPGRPVQRLGRGLEAGAARRRRPPRRLHLRIRRRARRLRHGLGRSARSHPRAGPRDRIPGRLPDPSRPVQVRPRPAGRPRPRALHLRLGRPRDRQRRLDRRRREPHGRDRRRLRLAQGRGAQGLFRMDADPRAGRRPDPRSHPAQLRLRRSGQPADGRDPPAGPRRTADLSGRHAGRGRPPRPRRLPDEAQRSGPRPAGRRPARLDQIHASGLARLGQAVAGRRQPGGHGPRPGPRHHHHGQSAADRRPAGDPARRRPRPGPAVDRAVQTGRALQPRQLGRLSRRSRAPVRRLRRGGGPAHRPGRRQPRLLGRRPQGRRRRPPRRRVRDQRHLQPLARRRRTPPAAGRRPDAGQ